MRTIVTERMELPRSNLGELLAVVGVVEFRTADQADTAGEEAAVKRRVGIGGASPPR